MHRCEPGDRGYARQQHICYAVDNTVDDGGDPLAILIRLEESDD